MAKTRGKAPPRGWQFWRKAFWTRPALLVLYGLALGVVGLLVLLSVIGAARDAVAMGDAAECPRSAPRVEADVDPPAGCLERVPVTLSGPWYSPGPGSDWHLLVERDGRQVFYAEADVPTTGSRRLTDDSAAEALLWEGKPVLIELPGGSRVETDEWGHRGWLLMLFIGMFVASAPPMLLAAARLKRMTTDSWWSVRGEPIGALGLIDFGPLMQVACLLAVPAMLGLIPLAVGFQVRWGIVAALAGLALVAYAIAKKRRTGPQ